MNAAQIDAALSQLVADGSLFVKQHGGEKRYSLTPAGIARAEVVEAQMLEDAIAALRHAALRVLAQNLRIYRERDAIENVATALTVVLHEAEHFVELAATAKVE